MSMFTPGNKVKLNPAILEDFATKANHHLFKRVLDENRTGEVLHLDTNTSSATVFNYWIKFQGFKIRLQESQFVLFSKS